MSDYVEFGENLDEDDYGLIVGSDGTLKGLFIPKGHEDQLVPDAIVNLCIEHFGIDPNLDDEPTIH